MPKQGTCPCCLRDVLLKDYHCHLQDLIADEIKTVLGYGTDRVAEQKEFTAEGHPRSNWNFRSEVVEVLRFARTDICSNCNSLDACGFWRAYRPKYFSFSAVEFERIRALAGHLSNKGPGLLEIFQEVGKTALADFWSRQPRAIEVGRAIGEEWLAADVYGRRSADAAISFK